MRDFPHIAEIDLPGSGLGSRLMDMHRWHDARGIRYHRGAGGNNVVRWCFADSETADAFAAEFGARRLPPQEASAIGAATTSNVHNSTSRQRHARPP